jgi:hypothetical protein
VLIRTVPLENLKDPSGAALLQSLSDHVEQILQAGIAVDADGTQRPDNSGLLLDAVLFTVRYVPSYPAPGEITGQVEILVDLLTADLGLLQAGGVDTPAEILLAEYNRLKVRAGE